MPTHLAPHAGNKRSRQSIALLCVTLSAVSFVVSACSSASAPPGEAPVTSVTVAQVVSRPTVDADEYTGQTEASAIVELRARVFGYLKTVDFKDGDYVKEGQTLFTIEPDEYQAIHDQSLARIKLNESKLTLAKSKLARNQLLIKEKAISLEEYEESVAAVTEAEATIGAAIADSNRTALDLKYTTIKAPIAGRIDRAYVTAGNLLTGGMSSGTLLTKIVQESPMYVYFDIDERSLLAYRKRIGNKGAETEPGSLRELNMKCQVQLADEKEFLHEGMLDFASAEVDINTGTARVRGEFKNIDRKLVSGLFVRVRVPIGEPYTALMIPEQSLATDQSIKFVYVVAADGTVERKNVEVGEIREGLRIVKSGLEPTDRVITRGVQRVKPGMKVNAEEVKLTAPDAPPPPTEEPAPRPVEPAAASPSAEAPPPATSRTNSPAEASE